MLNKKGVTVAMLTVAVIVIGILATTATISINNSLNYGKLSRFATEIQYIQDVVDEERAKSSSIDYIDAPVIFDTSELESIVLTEQFTDEPIIDNSITLYKLNLGSLRITNIEYGNMTDENDIYVVSNDTGRVYYLKGVSVASKTYYTLTTNLKDRFNITSSANDRLASIVFSPSILGYTNQPVRVSVKMPVTFTDIHVVTDNVDILVGNQNTVGDTYVYEVNTSDVTDNYDITVTYNDGVTSKQSTYKVNGYDIVAPVISDILDENQVSKLDTAGNARAYITNITVTDLVGKVKTVKYDYETISLEDAKSHFSTNGYVVKKGKIPLLDTVETYTIYAEDFAGNVTVKSVKITESILAALAQPGQTATVTGTDKAVLKRSAGLNLVNYQIYGDSKQELTNIFDINTSSRNNYYFMYDSSISAYRLAPVSGGATYLIPCEPNRTYIVSYNFNNGPSNSIFRTGYINEEISTSAPYTQVYWADVSMESKHTITTGSNAKYIAVQVTSSVIYYLPTNLKVEVAPSIDYPIDVVSLGENSRNLLNIAEAEEGTILLANGTNMEASNKCRTGYIYLKAGDYVLSSSGNVEFEGYAHKYSAKDQTTWLGFFAINGSGNIKPFTLNTDCYVRFVLSPQSGTTLTLTNLKNFTPQLEKGSVPTPYRPYRFIDIVTSGKNMIDKFNYYTSAGASNKWIKFEAGKSYTFSFENCTATNWRFTMLIYDLDKKALLPATETNTYLTTCYVSSNSGVGRLYLGYDITTKKHTVNCVKSFYGYKIGSFPGNAGEVNASTVFTNFMLEEGTEMTAYEPYHEPVVTTVDLTNYESLKGIKDVADYMNYKDQNVVRNINVLGNPTITVNKNDSNAISYAYFKGLKPYYALSEEAYCTHFARSYRTIPIFSYYSSQFKMALSGNNYYLYVNGYSIVTAPNSQQANANEINEWFARQTTNGHPVKVYYQAKDLSPYNITLPTIPTFSGTTYISAKDDKMQASKIVATYTK